MTSPNTNTDLHPRRRAAYLTVYRLAFIGVMAALVYVVSMFRFPFLGSKVHFGNTMCLLSGLLLGPVTGGLSAGLGSLLTDLLGGYPFWEALITFASKFAMAAVAGLIGHTLCRRFHGKRALTAGLTVTASVLGAWVYVGLYMAKHFVLQYLLYQVGLEATLAVMVSKFPASAINALFAMVCAPILGLALRPVLLRIPAYRRLETR